MAEESLKFKSGLNDADFQAGLKRMEKSAEQSAKRFQASQESASRKSTESMSRFVDVSKDGFKALGEIAIGAGIGLQLDNALVRVAELVRKIREANAEAGRAGAIASGERGAGAEKGFESRGKAIQDFNAELSKSKSLTDSIGSSLASASQEYFKQKGALIQSAEATGEITANEAKRATIENERAAALQDIASKQSALDRDRQETTERIANLEKELLAAKNSQYGADTATRLAGEKHAATIEGLISAERERKKLYDSQAFVLKEQQKSVEAIARARAHSQVKAQGEQLGKGIEEAQKKTLEESKKISESIRDDFKRGADEGALKLADQMERAKNSADAMKKSIKDAFDARVDNILKSPDQRRQDRRDSLDRDRARGRANRDIAREQRDAERRRRDGTTTTRKSPDGRADQSAMTPATIAALAKAIAAENAVLLTK